MSPYVSMFIIGDFHLGTTLCGNIPYVIAAVSVTTTTTLSVVVVVVVVYDDKRRTNK